MINFFPLLDEINEYKYVEIIDTPAYNRGKDLVEYSCFFLESLRKKSQDKKESIFILVRLK